MARKIEYDPVDWSDKMPHKDRITDFQEHSDNSEFKQDLDAWLETLKGQNPRERTLYTEDKLTRVAEELGNFSLRNFEKTKYTNYTPSKKGWYSANELIDMSIAKITFWSDSYKAWKSKKNKEEVAPALNEIEETIEEKQENLENSEVIKSQINIQSKIRNSSLFRKSQQLPQKVIDAAFKESEYEEFKKAFKKKSADVSVLPKTKIPEMTQPERKNQSILSLLTKMPMFTQNTFSVYFMYEKEKTNFFSLSNDEKRLPYKDIINGFCVKLSSFEVPQPKNQTYTIKFLEREIKKVSSAYEFNHKVELNFDMDYMGMLCQQFQLLSYGNPGNNEKLEYKIIDLNEHYTEQMFSAAFEGLKSLNMVVIYNDMSENGMFTSAQKFLKNDSYFRNGVGQIIGDTTSYRAFIFEDVQFLGLSKSLEFSRDSSSEVKMSAQFRFRNLAKFDGNRINAKRSSTN